MRFETFNQFLADARRGPPLTNSVSKAPMSRSRLQSLILQGFGQGRGEEFKPWIQITRGNAPRQSNHVVAVTSIGSRPLHLLSTLEHQAARVASWLGAVEIRSQFPLFPWRGHPHPEAGLDAAHDASLPPMPGLLEIARDAGIDHGTYVGAPELPYVATTDLLVRFGPAANQRLFFWTVKPGEKLAREKARSRTKQRIELERLYAKEARAGHVLYDGRQVNEDLVCNLDWLEPPRHERIDETAIRQRDRFIQAFNSRGIHEPLRDRIAAAAVDQGIDVATGQRAFRAAAWLTEIDIDLSRPILMSAPMQPGGAQQKQRVLRTVLGEAA